MSLTRCPVVVGRQAEIAAARAAVWGAAAGDGGVLLVLGEAGVGKTRLAREAEALAQGRGMRVLRGHAVRMAGFDDGPEDVEHAGERRFCGVRTALRMLEHPRLSSVIAISRCLRPYPCSDGGGASRSTGGTVSRCWYE
jgi:hypothetical protein